jgi:hypothetical protein
MRQSTRTTFIATRGFHAVLPCRAAVVALDPHLRVRIVRRHRKSAGSRWRKLNPGQQALLVLAYLRKGETFAELAAGAGVGTTTVWRYVHETAALLAARDGPGRRGGHRAPHVLMLAW